MHILFNQKIVIRIISQYFSEFLLGLYELLFAEIKTDQEPVKCVAYRKDLSFAHICLDRADEFIIDLLLLLLCGLINILCQVLILVN